MNLGIVGAIGVDDIGDVIMLRTTLTYLDQIAKSNNKHIHFIIYAIDSKKAEEQIKELCIDFEIHNCLRPENIAYKDFDDFSFREILKQDFSFLLKENKNYYNSFNKCDGIFFLGGGYFNSYWGKNIISMFLVPIVLSYQKNKSVFISGINIGPFNKKEKENLYGIFKKVDYLILRDKKSSIIVLNELGGSTGKVILGADDILHPWYEEYDNLNINFSIQKKNRYAVIQLHHWVETYSINYIKFYKELARFLGYLLDKGFLDKIYFVPFNYYKGVDYECGRRLKTFLDDREQYIVLKPSTNHIFIRKLISNSEFVISSRYHPIVFGLGDNVPVLGIYVNDLYEQKISGAFDVLNLDKKSNMIYVNNVSFDSLYNWYASLEKYKKNINKTIFNMINKYDINRKNIIKEFIDKLK